MTDRRNPDRIPEIFCREGKGGVFSINEVIIESLCKKAAGTGKAFHGEAGKRVLGRVIKVHSYFIQPRFVPDHRIKIYP